MGPKWIARLLARPLPPPPLPLPPPPPPVAYADALWIAAGAALLLVAYLLMWLLVLRRRLHGKILEPGESPAPLASLAVLKNGYSSKKVPAEIDTIVIGSGMGGLTAAALLAKRGQRVLVLEQHDVAGGCTHTFEERGFEFDTGLHYVGDILGTLMNTVTSGRIEWALTGALVDEVHFGSERVPILSPKSAFLDELRRRFPGEATALRHYPWAVVWAHVVLSLHLCLKNLPSAIGAPLRWLLGPMQTTAQGLASLTNDPKLQQLLGYIWGTYGVPPSRSPYALHLVLLNHYANGGYYPVGGCSQLAARLVPTIEAAGGAVLVRAKVSSLVCDEASGAVLGVIVRDQTLTAARVISAVGAINTFCRLVPSRQRPRLEGILRSIRDAPPIAPPVGTKSEVEPSCAFLYLFLGVEGTSILGSSPNLVDLPKHNLWCFDGWDHEAQHGALPPALGNVAEEHPLLLFISSPSSKDPAWAARHGSKQVVLALAPTRCEYWAGWAGTRIKHRGAEYEDVKRKLTSRMTDAVLAKLPQLRGHLAYCDLGTPLSNNYYLGTQWGEAYGLSHTPARFAQEWLTPQTPLPNLYLTGQDIATDGVTGAVLSGLLTAGAIDKRVWLATAGSVVAGALQAITA